MIARLQAPFVHGAHCQIFRAEYCDFIRLFATAYVIATVGEEWNSDEFIHWMVEAVDRLSGEVSGRCLITPVITNVLGVSS